jgi:hypothetical protein
MAEYASALVMPDMVFEAVHGLAHRHTYPKGDKTDDKSEEKFVTVLP